MYKVGTIIDCNAKYHSYICYLV